jgi:DNA-binding response OmpR family regulator
VRGFFPVQPCRAFRPRPALDPSRIIQRSGLDQDRDSGISFTLEHEGYEAFTAATGDAGLKLYQETPPDLVILDLMLPDCSGIDICRAMRILGNVPILFLTARDQLDDKVEAFENGADDYLAKPFRYKELVMRVKALLRRTGPTENALSYGGISLDAGSHQVKLNGELIYLTLREHQLLELLLKRPNHVYTRSQILQTVWGWDAESDTNVLEVQISALRAKLGDTDRKLIRTVRGVGYSLG